MKAVFNFTTLGVFLVLVHHIVNRANSRRIEVEYTERNSPEVLLVQQQIRTPIASKFEIY